MLTDDGDVRDRAATPPEWYDEFRPATWEEAMSLTAQELLRIKGTLVRCAAVLVRQMQNEETSVVRGRAGFGTTMSTLYPASSAKSVAAMTARGHRGGLSVVRETKGMRRHLLRGNTTRATRCSVRSSSGPTPRAPR